MHAANIMVIIIKDWKKSARAADESQGSSQEDIEEDIEEEGQGQQEELTPEQEEELLTNIKETREKIESSEKVEQVNNILDLFLKNRMQRTLKSPAQTFIWELQRIQREQQKISKKLKRRRNKGGDDNKELDVLKKKLITELNKLEKELEKKTKGGKRLNKTSKKRSKKKRKTMKN